LLQVVIFIISHKSRFTQGGHNDQPLHILIKYQPTPNKDYGLLSSTRLTDYTSLYQQNVFSLVSRDL